MIPPSKAVTHRVTAYTAHTNTRARREQDTVSNAGMGRYLTDEYRATGFDAEAQARREAEQGSRANLRRAAELEAEHQRETAREQREQGTPLGKIVGNTERRQETEAQMSSKGMARHLID